jgi:hypothetical protein
MNNITACMCLLLVIGCDQNDKGIQSHFANVLEHVESKEVIYQDETWIELTIKQQIDPNAPMYIVGIRDNKANNRLRWSLSQQIFAEDYVTTYFRIKPVNDMDAIVLSRDDFDWHPKVINFGDIKIKTK